MKTEASPKDPVSDGEGSDVTKPKRSLPEAVVIALDDLATQDDADLSLVLGIVDPEEDDADEDAKAH